MTDLIDLAERVERLSPAQRKTVLAMLGPDTEFTFRHFAKIEEDGGDRQSVRQLRDMGLAVFARGLFDEDGKIFGAGYALTTEGCAVQGHIEDAALRARGMA